MRASVALTLCALVGCNHGGLPGTGVSDLAVSPAADMSVPRIDLANADLTNPCAPGAPNTTVSGLPFSYLGNVDLGGEALCGGNPEGVVVVLYPDATIADQPAQTQFTLGLPLKLGPQVASLRSGTKTRGVPVDVKAFTLRGSGPAVATLTMDFDVPDLALSGSVSPRHCPMFDLVCI